MDREKLAEKIEFLTEARKKKSKKKKSKEEKVSIW